MLEPIASRRDRVAAAALAGALIPLAEQTIAQIRARLQADQLPLSPDESEAHRGIAALLGYALFGQFSPNIVAATTAVAAGAILAMLADTMIPEAFEQAHNFAGLITVVGFLVAFVLTKITEK